jgi:hypothetical protein
MSNMTTSPQKIISTGREDLTPDHGWPRRLIVPKKQRFGW